MRGPNPAAVGEDPWAGGDAETGPATGHPFLVFVKRLVWVLISLLVILALLAPLLAPIFRGRQTRPKDRPDGLQASHQPPAVAWVSASKFP